MAFKELIQKFVTEQEKVIVFVGTLHCYNDEIFLMQSGMTQAIRLFFDEPSALAYHVTEAKLYAKKETVKTFQIQPVGYGYRFKSPDSENLFLMCRYSWNEEDSIPFSMGTIIIHKKISGWQASEFSVLFNKKWLKHLQSKNAIFLTWDVGAWRFVELDSKVIF